MSLVLQYLMCNNRLLPAEYQEVEYLECTGTQMLNTNFTVSNNTKICGKWSNMTWASGEYRLLYGANPDSMVITGWCASSGYNWRWGGIAPSTQPTYNLNSVLFTEQSKDGIRLNNTLVATYSGTPSFPTSILYLFGYPGFSYFLKGRCYYVNIWDNNVLVRHFIPCYRKSDSVPGMFDIVGQQFYTNAGSGAFVVGPNVSKIECNATGGGGDCIIHDTNTYSKPVPTSSYSEIKVYNSIRVVHPYEVYTLSFDAYSSTAGSVLTTYFYNNASGIVQVANSKTSQGNTYTATDGTSQHTLTTSWVRYWVTWTFNGSAAALKHIVMRTVSGTNNGSTIYIRNIRLQSGYNTPYLVNSNATITNVGYDPDSPLIHPGSYKWVNNTCKMHTTISSIGNTFSVSWWAKKANFGAGDMMWGFSDGNRLNPLFQLCLNTGDSLNNPWKVPGTTTTITAPAANQWHHLVITGNGSTNKLYVDGVHYGTSTTFKGMTGTSIYFSGWDTSTSYVFSGNLADFRIYNHALTDDEVKEIYNQRRI